MGDVLDDNDFDVPIYFNEREGNHDVDEIESFEELKDNELFHLAEEEGKNGEKDGHPKNELKGNIIEGNLKLNKETLKRKRNQNHQGVPREYEEDESGGRLITEEGHIGSPCQQEREGNTHREYTNKANEMTKEMEEEDRVEREAKRQKNKKRIERLKEKIKLRKQEEWNRKQTSQSFASLADEHIRDKLTKNDIRSGERVEVASNFDLNNLVEQNTSIQAMILWKLCSTRLSQRLTNIEIEKLKLTKKAMTKFHFHLPTAPLSTSTSSASSTSSSSTEDKDRDRNESRKKGSLSQRNVTTPTSSNNLIPPIVQFVKGICPSLTKLVSTPESRKIGSPFVVIISSSAVRANVLAVDLRKNTKYRTAKLFAKHMKLQDQQKLLEEGVQAIAVGTPNRINKLLELGALNLSATKHVILDMCPDQKGCNLLNLLDIKEDTLNFITNYVLPNLSHLKISLFSDSS